MSFGWGRGGQQPVTTITLRAKLITSIFIEVNVSNIVKIVIIYDSFSFPEQTSHDLPGQRIFAKALLECQRFRLSTSGAFLITSTPALCQL